MCYVALKNNGKTRTTMGKSWDKFALLTWKNWLLQIRFPLQTAVEVLLPVVFCVLLVLMRGLIEPEHNDEKIFPSFSLANEEPGTSLPKIAYSPCKNGAVETIMRRVGENYVNTTIECYENSADLERALWDNMNLTLAGVQFDDSLIGSSELGEDVEVTLRFPAELRNSTSYMEDDWSTNMVFALFQTAGPREPTEKYGAAPNYFNEGFLTLQYWISTEIIKHQAKDESLDIPEVLMQRFPYPEWFSDPLLEAMRSMVVLVFVLSFASICINTVKVITIEKEKQLKEAMKIMGLPNWLHWTAWFCKAFILILITVILMVILLKVPWYPGTDFTVFTYTDPFLLFFFLVCYACATITFCFAVSVFFSKANTATTVAGVVWFLTYVIYAMVQNQYNTTPLGQKMLISLAINSAMAYGFQLFLMWEGSGKGLGWSDIFTPFSPDDDFTLGHVILMLLVDALLYLLIALYVEAVFPGEYGVPLVWYYPFTKSYWCGNQEHIETTQLGDLSSEFYEKEPTNLRIGIQANKLTKIFPGEKVAVKDLAFNMYEGQITVLLGHNGAGKTTTMSMLTGMITPTSGTATVNGHDIRRDMGRVRESLGLCPQHNILFDDLTVGEHIYFYSRLKGMSKSAAQKEIDHYVQLLELVPKKAARSKTLSGGMKRKLSVAVALCGNSKVCMLDEPTAGMDPAARRALWDMIKKQKENRTILLSTHFMDEADLLGDRIAIMAGGQLQCCGTSFFLKKKYGAGYHLVMDKSQDCDINGVTDILRRHIPNIKVETNIGSELSYILAEKQSAVFETMLRDLENESHKIGVNSYGISLTTMEEVFMKVGADHGQEDAKHAITNGSDTNGNSHSYQEDRLITNDDKILSGFPLWKNQFMAMILKKMCTTYRTWYMFLFQNIIPIAILTITLINVNMASMGQDLPSLHVSLDPFRDPVTVVSPASPQNPYHRRYLEVLESEGREVENAANMTETMLRLTAENSPTIRMRYIVGATFEEDTITAWFNNEPFHSPPVALQYSMNAILQATVSTNHVIRFINHPLPFSAETKFQQMTMMGAGYQVAFNLAISLAFVTPFYVLFYIKERVNKSKHLQLVSGARIPTFWFAAAAWDFVTFQVTSVVIIITIVCWQEDGLSTATEMGRVYLVLLIFILAILPLTYLASFIFDVPSTGYSRLSILKILTGGLLFTVVQVLSIDGLNLKHVADGIHYAFSILPHYSLAAALISMSNKHSTIQLCEMIATFGADPCMVNRACCDLNENYFNIDDGMGLSLIYMTMVCIVGFCLLFMIEFRVFHGLLYKLRNKRRVGSAVGEEPDDSDVLEEKRKVHDGVIRPSEYDVVLKDITKQYSNYLAVNKLCLGIKGHECFGLLGINGAGKTTTFKMMTGDEIMTYGDAWIRNYNLKTSMKDVHQNLGYCPQFDALLDDLTGKETLMMYCLLRGIPLNNCPDLIKRLARDFDFEKHLNKQVKQFSGGNKRKLSSAIAVIGDPPVIFLDEPTAGMDPATKRNLWNTLCKIRDKGKCLVLTSHSMEECEALCTRLAIMVNGVFKCLGSTQHLKNKFSEGYMLVVKVKKAESGPIVVYGTETQIIEQYIRSNFPTAVLRESHQELLTFFIPDTSLPWSRMFGIMEQGKREVANLEDYSLGQSNLEQVFLLFTKQQRTVAS